jgi:ribonuclease BN (tRNA processing enzyme)
MDIYFLGTGSAVPTPDRDNTALYIEDEGNGLLIDCPGSPLSKLTALGVNPASIKSILITHMHTDHVYGLPSLFHSLKPAGIAPIIFAPAAFADSVKALLKLFDLDNLTEIIPADYMIDIPFRAGLFPTSHKGQSRGIKIERGGRSIIYTSDTGPIADSAKLFRDADYLIHDCYTTAKWAGKIANLDITHTSALRLGIIASDAKVKNLVPIHFSGEHRELESELRSEIRKSYRGKIIMPKDMQKIKI